MRQAWVEEGCVSRSFRRYESRVETGDGAAWRRRRKWGLRIVMPEQYYGQRVGYWIEYWLLACVEEEWCVKQSWAEQSRWTLLSGCSALEANDECTEDEAEAGQGLTAGR